MVVRGIPSNRDVHVEKLFSFQNAFGGWIRPIEHASDFSESISSPLNDAFFRTCPGQPQLETIWGPIVVARRAKPWFQAWRVLGYLKGHDFVFGIHDTLVVIDCKRIKDGGLHHPAFQLQTQSPRATQLQLKRIF